MESFIAIRGAWPEMHGFPVPWEWTEIMHIGTNSLKVSRASTTAYFNGSIFSLPYAAYQFVHRPSKSLLELPTPKTNERSVGEGRPIFPYPARHLSGGMQRHRIVLFKY